MVKRWTWTLFVLVFLLVPVVTHADDGSQFEKDLNPKDLAAELDDIARQPEGGLRARAPEASCSGTGCNGTDPSTTGCSADGRTVAYTTIYDGSTQVGRVELRWSPSCQTNWSRVTRLSSNALYVYASAFLSPNPWGDPKHYEDGGYVGVNQTWWSHQVYAPTTPWRGCGILGPNEGSDAGSDIACTILR